MAVLGSPLTTTPTYVRRDQKTEAKHVCLPLVGGVKAGKLDDPNEAVKIDAIAELTMKRGEEIPFEEEAARKKKLTSIVWETFTPMCSSGLRDGLIDSAKCNVCNKIFSTRHGTSSMMRHAKRHNEFPNGATLTKKPKKNGTNVNGSAKKSPVLKKTEGLVPTFDENGGGTIARCLLCFCMRDEEGIGFLTNGFVFACVQE